MRAKGVSCLMGDNAAGKLGSKPGSTGPGDALGV
jgi:hypothetical protein